VSCCRGPDTYLDPGEVARACVYVREKTRWEKHSYLWPRTSLEETTIILW